MRKTSVKSKIERQNQNFKNVLEKFLDALQVANNENGNECIWQKWATING